jgi:hypothetical protein
MILNSVKGKMHNDLDTFGHFLGCLIITDLLTRAHTATHTHTCAERHMTLPRSAWYQHTAGKRCAERNWAPLTNSGSVTWARSTHTHVIEVESENEERKEPGL